MQLLYVQVRPTPPVSHCPSCKLPDACQVLLKGVAGGFVKEDKVDLFQTALSAFKMLKHGCYHQLRTLTYGETGHAGANGRKGNCLQLLLVGPQSEFLVDSTSASLVVRGPLSAILAACITYRAFRLPPLVMTASPMGMGPILLHSSWIEGPPFRLIAPATPPPSIRSLFAAFTMASTSISVRSPCSIIIFSFTAPPAFLVKIVLQDKLRRDHISPLRQLLSGESAFLHGPVGPYRAQALVHQVHSQRETSPEFLGEGERFLRGLPKGVTHSLGETHDYLIYSPFLDNPGKRLHVVRNVPALKGRQSLSRNTQGIAYRQAQSLFTVIYPKDSHMLPDHCCKHNPRSDGNGDIVVAYRQRLNESGYKGGSYGHYDGKINRGT